MKKLVWALMLVAIFSAAVSNVYACGAGKGSKAGHAETMEEGSEAAAEE